MHFVKPAKNVVWTTGLLVVGLCVGAALAQHGTQATETKTDLSDAGKQQILANYGRMPLAFEANRGQSDAQVKFQVRGAGYTLFLTPTEAVLALAKTDARPTIRNAGGKIIRTAVSIKLVGANPTARAEGMAELPGKSNYIIGNDPTKWHTDVPTYEKVKFEAVYPGVDVVYYGKQGQLEHDFIVGPGSDPREITLGFEGAEKISLDAQGNLALATQGDEVRLKKPVVYQEVDGMRQEIASAYVLRGNSQAGFEVAAYDSTRPLVIDPVLSYSTYLGGTLEGTGFGRDAGQGIAVDSTGAAYVTGLTRSSNFPTANAAQGASGGSTDAFVTKLNAAGSAVVYSTYLGGSLVDEARSIAVDSTGAAYVTGSTFSSNFPTASAYDGSLDGQEDAFVTKLNAAGGLAYSTYLGGSSLDAGIGIAVDSSGSAYVTGQAGADFPTTPGAFQPGIHGLLDAFVTKLNATGSTLDYSSYLGGSDEEAGRAIAVDASGSAYVAGLVRGSTDFPTTAGAYQTTFAGGQHDAFVTKVNAAGSALVYSTYLGGGDTDQILGIAVDSSGSAYVTGVTLSTNFPTTTGAFQTAYAGGSSDAFVTKLNAAGSALTYSTFLGGSDLEQGLGIAVDSSGSAYVAGPTNSSSFPTTPGAFQTTYGGQGDAFLANLDPAGGALVYSTFLGSTDFDEARGVALDASGSVYVTGQAGTGFPTTPGAFQTTATADGLDAFVAKFATQAPVITSVNGPVAPISIGTLATITANFTDANATDTHTCSLSWDDGSPDTEGVIVEPTTGDPGQCTASHNYAEPGIYTVEVTVTDSSGASDSEVFEYVVIYDPSGGFVTGGGWINSPVGAYAANPSLSGKATFGFVSRYQKGASTPKGETQFQFELADFDFHSMEYEWLVVSGARAQYKGTGTVNGTGTFGFMLTAKDGQQQGGGGVDKFRIKIWDTATSAVLYDNVAGLSDDADPQALGDGSIVIHK